MTDKFQPGDRVYTVNAMYFKKNGLSRMRDPGQWCHLEDLPHSTRNPKHALPFVLVAEDGGRSPAWTGSFVPEAEGLLIENVRGLSGD